MRKNKDIEEEYHKHNDVEVPVSPITVMHHDSKISASEHADSISTITTCDKEVNTESHEFNNININECTMEAFRNSSININECKHQNHNDNDSALSSAPQSLSPQLSVCSNIENLHDTDEKLRELDFLQKKYDTLKQELIESRDQICELENTITVRPEFEF